MWKNDGDSSLHGELCLNRWYASKFSISVYSIAHKMCVMCLVSGLFVIFSRLISLANMISLCECCSAGIHLFSYLNCSFIQQQCYRLRIFSSQRLDGSEWWFGKDVKGSCRVACCSTRSITSLNTSGGKEEVTYQWHLLSSRWPILILQISECDAV